MKLFGWKAGREGARPVLARVGVAGVSSLGAWPPSYEAQVRAGYAANPVVQRAVRLVAEGVVDAPVDASDPALSALVAGRSMGQPLLASVATHLLLHGNAYVQILRDAEGGVAELYALRPSA